MIDFKLQKSSKFLYLGLAGIFIALSGSFIYVIDPLAKIINSVATLKENGLMFNIWKSPPYEVLVKVFVFNVTNSKEFLRNGTKMKVVEVGPYIYQERLFNQNAHFNPNGTLTFEPKRSLIFRRDLSIGDPKVDKVISPNIPLLGISSSLKDASFFVNLAVSQIANVLNSKPFLELTIEEYLWGYDDRLVTLANKAIPSWINFPRFGIMDRLMSLDNATNTVTIRTRQESSTTNNMYVTKTEANMPYTIVKFNGSPGLHQWGYEDTLGNSSDIESNSRCNSIEGSFVEGIFGYNLQANTTIRLYRRAFCRPVDATFESMSTSKDGFASINFRVAKNFLASVDENPDNKCYCYKGKCPKKGLSYLSPCYYGIPIIISQPHFYNAAPELLTQVEGLSPDIEKHDTTLSVHPELGVPLEAKLRIQINLDVDTKYSAKCAPFNKLTVPLFWLEMRIEGPPGTVKFILYMLYSVLPIGQQVLIWFCMLFGVAMIAAAALFTFYLPPRNHGLEDPFEGRIGYSPIRIIPMTQQYINPAFRISN